MKLRDMMTPEEWATLLLIAAGVAALWAIQFL